MTARVHWLCRAGVHLYVYVPERQAYVCRRGCGTTRAAS